MSITKSHTKRVQDEAINWLARLNSSQLSEADEQAFTQWLEASALHQAAYIKAEELWERGAVVAKLREPKRAKAVRFAPWQGWAAACSCLFAVAFILLQQFNGTHEYLYQTALGEQKELDLEDGSHLILNTNSQLRVSFNRHGRSVDLTQGEVFFDVKKDGRPFEIHTAQGTVKVLGTRFSVYQTLTDTLVTVVEGRVGLGEKSTAQDDFKPSVVLQANQRLSLQAAKSGQAAEAVNANAALAWRKKQLVFKGQNLNQVIAELGRYFPETITLAEPDLSNKEITAVIQISDIKTTLNTLALSLGLEVEYNPANHSAKLKTKPQP